MSRQPRIQYPNAIYHIFNRGINRNRIFHDASDYNLFLDCLAEVAENSSLEVWCYALLDNHYHLLVRTPKGNLVQAMQRLQRKFSVAYNRKHYRLGPLYQGRYRAIIVEEPAYLRELARYIHLSPFRRKLIKRLGRYRWCSYRAYAGLEEFPKWLSPEPVLAEFGTEQEAARRSHKQFVMAGRDLPEWSPFNVALEGLILGTKERLRKLVAGKRDESVAFSKDIGRSLHFEPSEVIEKLCDAWQIETKELLKPRNRGSRHRQAAIYLCRKYTNWTLKELGELFGGIAYSGVNQCCRRVHTALQSESEKELSRLIHEGELSLQMGNEGL